MAKFNLRKAIDKQGRKYIWFFDILNSRCIDLGLPPVTNTTRYLDRETPDLERLELILEILNIKLEDLFELEDLSKKLITINNN